MIFGDETHPGGEGMSAFVFPSVTTARVLTSTFVGSKALRKNLTTLTTIILGLL